MCIQCMLIPSMKIARPYASEDIKIKRTYLHANIHTHRGVYDIDTISKKI